MICDKTGYDLLFIAAEAGNTETVKFFMQILNLNLIVNDKTAIDLAWENKHYETVVALLKANSRFPSNFKYSKYDPTLPVSLKRFAITAQKIHGAIQKKNIREILDIIRETPGLRYFFNHKNVSALAAAIMRKDFLIYQFLIERNILLGPCEIFNDLLEKLTAKEREDLAEINDRNLKPIAEKHLMTLLSNTDVGFDDELSHTRLAHVFKALQKLNAIKDIKILLEYVAATRKFQLIFDFNRDHIQHLDPRSKNTTNGVFYFNGRIYIAALYLLDVKRFNEVLGVIAHEICHFVMLHIYENQGRPYTKDSESDKSDFQMILTICFALKSSEPIIDCVERYEEQQWHAELIVRGPHIIAHYCDDPERLQELHEIFPELMRYYFDKCLPKIEEKLPEVRALNEERARKENKKLNANGFSICKYFSIFSIIALLLFTIAFGVSYVTISVEISSVENFTYIPIESLCGYLNCGQSDKIIECSIKNGTARCIYDPNFNFTDCSKKSSSDNECENGCKESEKCENGKCVFSWDDRKINFNPSDFHKSFTKKVKESGNMTILKHHGGKQKLVKNSIW